MGSSSIGGACSRGGGRLAAAAAEWRRGEAAQLRRGRGRGGGGSELNWIARDGGKEGEKPRRETEGGEGVAHGAERKKNGTLKI